MPRSLYSTQKVLDFELRGTSYTAPTSRKMKLFTAPPDSHGVGGVEVSAADYAAQTVTFAACDANGQSANDALITFTAGATPSDWTPGATRITHFKIEDQAANCLYWGKFANPITVLAGNPLSFAIGIIKIRNDETLGL